MSGQRGTPAMQRKDLGPFPSFVIAPLILRGLHMISFNEIVI